MRILRSVDGSTNSGAGLRDRAYTWTASAYLILAAAHAQRHPVTEQPAKLWVADQSAGYPIDSPHRRLPQRSLAAQRRTLADQVHGTAQAQQRGRTISPADI